MGDKRHLINDAWKRRLIYLNHQGAIVTLMVAFVIAESSQKLGKVGGRGSRTLWVFRCAGAPVSHAKFQLSPPRRCAKLTFLTKVSPRLENVELSGRSMMPSIAPVFRNYTHFGDLQGYSHPLSDSLS